MWPCTESYRRFTHKCICAEYTIFNSVLSTPSQILVFAFVQSRQISIVCYQHLPKYLCLHITTLRVSSSETFGAVSYLLQHGEKSADLILLYATKTQTRVSGYTEITKFCKITIYTYSTFNIHNCNWRVNHHRGVY